MSLTQIFLSIKQITHYFSPMLRVFNQFTSKHDLMGYLGNLCKIHFHKLPDAWFYIISSEKKNLKKHIRSKFSLCIYLEHLSFFVKICVHEHLKKRIEISLKFHLACKLKRWGIHLNCGFILALMMSLMYEIPTPFKKNKK